MERNCNVCGQLYHAEARYVNRGQGLTCGRVCGAKYATLKRQEANPIVPNTTCYHCGEALYRKPSHLSRTDIFFCDKACQVASQRSGEFESNPYTGGTCQFCKERTGKNARGVPIRWHQSCKGKDDVERWLSGDNSATLVYSGATGDPRDTKGFVKRYLLKTRGDRCEECGFDKHGPYGSIIQMDHVNGDCFDNRPENLKLLCPNCHAMTPTYGARNRGSGRAHRRKG